MVTGASDLVTVTADLKHETQEGQESFGAYLIDDGSDEKVWVPKSQCQRGKHLRGSTYEFEMPEWLAHEKGLI